MSCFECTTAHLALRDNPIKTLSSGQSQAAHAVCGVVLSWDPPKPPGGGVLGRCRGGVRAAYTSGVCATGAQLRLAMLTLLVSHPQCETNTRATSFGHALVT